MEQKAYDALRNRAAFLDLTGRGKLRASGEDRARLLHAMCTNQVHDLMPGMGCYAFFLSSQGRILADANIFCLPDHLLLDTDPETRATLQEHLDKFIIADDVTLADFTPITATINVEGKDAERVMSELGGPAAHVPYAVVEWGKKQVAHTNYTGTPGYSIFVMDDEKEALLDELRAAGVVEADQETIELVRIENGHPRFGKDFSAANIPQETQRMDAVHFSKGCYLGQEIVERVRSRGHVNRTLVSVEIDAPQAPLAHSKVTGNGKEVGEITSAAFSPTHNKTVAIAMLRAESLSGPLQCEGAELRVRKQPSL